MTSGHRIRKTYGFERAIETVLGVVLGIAALVPAAVAVGALAEIFRGPNAWGAEWAAPLVVVISAITAWWCFGTAWRLCTGRPNDTGGLLSPFVLRLAGVACVALAVVMLAKFGLPALGRAAQCLTAALGLLVLADERVQVRLRRQSRKVNQPRT